MSLLLSEGHPHAADYPLWQLGVEAKLVTERIDRHAVSDAYYTQSAIAALLDKKSAKDWGKIMKKVFNDG